MTFLRQHLNTEYRRIVSEEALYVARAELPLTEDDPLVDLPDDWTRILVARWSTYVLQPRTRADYINEERKYTSSDEPTYGPRIYTIEPPNRIRIYPKPTADDDDGLIVDYVVRPDEMVNSTDTPSVIPVEYHDLLGELTIHRIALGEEERGLAADAKDMADEIRSRLSSHLKNIRGGDIVPQMQVWGLTR